MITIDFHFKHRKAEDLEQLNAILAAMRLKSLALEDLSGYLAVTRDGDGNLLHKRYGLDCGTLICEPATGGNGDQYQIDTSVVSHSVDYDEFISSWRASNPDRAMRTVITMNFEEDYACIIAHHRKRDQILHITDAQ